jgi:hypothetical protein
MYNLTMTDKPQPLARSTVLPRAISTLPLSASIVNRLLPSLLTAMRTLSMVPPLRFLFLSTQRTTTHFASPHPQLLRRSRLRLRITHSTHPHHSRLPDHRNWQHATVVSVSPLVLRLVICQQQVRLHSQFLHHTKQLQDLQ